MRTGTFDCLSAVVFDMDGLLLDTESVTRTCWQQAALNSGSNIDDDLYSQLIGLTFSDSDALLRAALGDRFDFKEFYSRAEGSFVDVTEREGIRVKRGAHLLLKFLRQSGVGVAVATSTAYVEAARRLRRAGLSSLIPFVVAGDQVKRGKPAPDIFLQAAKLLGVPPAECLVLEDSEPGLYAALAAGMKAILVPDLAPSSSPALHGVSVLRNLEEVRRYLRQAQRTQVSSTRSNRP